MRVGQVVSAVGIKNEDAIAYRYRVVGTDGGCTDAVSFGDKQFSVGPR